MGILEKFRGNMFSKRQKRLRGEILDVYQYDVFPNELRVQIVQIWQRVFKDQYSYARHDPNDAYWNIVEYLRHEWGEIELPSFASVAAYDYFGELANNFLEEQNNEKALDVVEASFRVMEERKISNRNSRVPKNHRISDFEVSDAIDDLNFRFKERGVGYGYESNQIIRIDDEFVHEEVVKPALRILNQPQFSGAQEEFLKAHQQYRKGNTKDSLSNCLKAFESVMKAICDKRGWQYDKDRSTAQALIKICFDNGLIPKFWGGHYSSLRSILESGVPTGRNKLGGHGQGTAPITVPDYLTAYMLHMTATTIVFLAEAEKELQK